MRARTEASLAAILVGIALIGGLWLRKVEEVRSIERAAEPPTCIRTDPMDLPPEFVAPRELSDGIWI